MNRRIRFAIAGVLLAGIAAFGASITIDPSAGKVTGPPPRFSTAAECAQCHAEVFAEWQASHHKIAYTNPEVRKLSEDFRNKECQACHLPRPLVETGLLERTLPRVSRPDDGVDCLTCHLGPEGRIVGRHASSKGCAPVADARFMSVDACESCHNQHQTTDQWKASRYAKDGVTCMECHMPRVARSDGTAGRSHVYPGCHDLTMLKKAAVTEVSVQNGALVLDLENRYTGHNLPTEERHRAVDWMVRFVDADGKASEWTRAYRFRSPYRNEPGEDTQLPAGQSHRATVPIPAGAKRAEARLWYRLNPYAVDGDAASELLEEHAVELK